MSEYEVIQIVINSSMLLTLVVSAFLVYRQVTLIVKTHNDNHDLQRRGLTEQALTGIRNTDTSRLKELLNHDSKTASIPLDEILAVFNKDSVAQDQCHRLLNYYDNMAHGIFLGTYDEPSIKANRQGSMQKTFSLFKEYIYHRRAHNYLYSAAWSTTERLIRDWHEEDYESNNTRKKTGTIK